MLVSPCLNCDKRHLRCHSDCEEYKQFQFENEKRKKYAREKRESNNDLVYSFKKGSTYYCKNKNK